MKTFSTIFTLAMLITAVSTLTAQTNWEKYPANPVLRPGSAAEWDGYEVYAPCVIKQGDSLKMWYTGSKSFAVDHIGYAVSIDGMSWQKYKSNPVLRVGSSGNWDSENVVHPEVVFDGSMYHMWYGGSDDPSWFKFSIGYATSPDGITWTKYNDPSTTDPPYAESDPVMTLGPEGSWDNASYAGGTCFFDGDTFHLWYGACDGSNWVNSRIGYAKSTDGINWTKYNDPSTTDLSYAESDPVMTLGPEGSWDSQGVTVPFVIGDDTGYKMWYQGFDGSHRRIGYATSLDGINWKKVMDNPVLEAGNHGAWDDDYVDNPTVLADDSTYHMWYSGVRDNTGSRIGYAFDIPTKIGDSIHSNIPFDYVLQQNFTNPFNPKTVISWQLAFDSHVELSIYNILGQKIETLTNQLMLAGYHEVEFNGQNLSSGIYLYRIEAGEWQDVKKMVLLK